VRSDTVPSFSKCQLVEAAMCWFTVMWDQNTNQSNILVDSIDFQSANYAVEKVIIAVAKMEAINRHQISQVNHSLGYICLSDNCNDEMTLKRILRSLVIEEKFAQELIPLLEIVSPFDPKSAACYDFINSTDDCPRTDLSSCQRCEISVDRQPSPTQQICASCPDYSEVDNSVSHQIIFLLDSRTQEQDIAKVNCQLKACNSMDNINRVYKASNITFNFGEFFQNSSDNTL